MEYIGETGRQLKIRMMNEADSKLDFRKKLNKKKKTSSGLSDHLKKENIN